MKRCPICNSTFDDEGLSYCTTDGTVLVRDEISANLESQATAILGEPPATVLMPPRPTEYVPQAPAHAPSSEPVWRQTDGAYWFDQWRLCYSSTRRYSLSGLSC